MLQHYLSQLPLYLLSLPLILLALSFHEMCHGYAALWQGDPTARNLGRLTLNPLKHLDPIGFLCMLLFHFGWAKPVPVNTRNFHKPRQGMALTALAGPVSNLVLSFVHVLLLRLTLLIFEKAYPHDFVYMIYTPADIGYAGSKAGIFLAILTYVFFLGAYLNLTLAIFNLIPIPPLDGSRIAFLLLPPKAYFGVMKYERYISIGIMLLLFFTNVITGPLSWLCEKILDGMFFLVGMPTSPMYFILSFVQTMLGG